MQVLREGTKQKQSKCSSAVKCYFSDLLEHHSGNTYNRYPILVKVLIADLNSYVQFEYKIDYKKLAYFWIHLAEKQTC